MRLEKHMKNTGQVENRVRELWVPPCRGVFGIFSGCKSLILDILHVR